MGSITKITTNSVKDGEVKTANINDSGVTTAKIADDAVTSTKINNSVVSADDLASTLDLSSKTLTLPNNVLNTQHFNVALLAFKMAVNDSLTVFNLVDGVVDEFHDESGTDESEGSNDNYCASSDFYDNVSCSPISAGFSITAITEPQTSVTSTNPAQKNNTLGQFTVPSGMTSLNMQAWGASGGTSGYEETSDGGGGGYAEGTIAVTASQVIKVAVGEGGAPVNHPQTSNGGAGIQNGGGNAGGPSNIPVSGCGARATGGGGASGVLTACASRPMGGVLQPEIYIAAGGGGGSGYVNPSVGEYDDGPGGTGYPDIAAGGGGGLTGGVGGFSAATSNYGQARGGGGDQEQGGQGGASVNPPPDGAAGSALAGGRGATCDPNAGGGGDGYYGGGGGGSRNPTGPSDVRTGGGGSSYYGHPQVTSGSTEAAGGSPGLTAEGGGVDQPGYVAGTNEGKLMASTGSPSYAFGEDGYVLLTGGIPQAQSTTIVSNAFTAGSAPSTSRIVVFQENIDSITLNTDVVASISRDGGSNFTTVTLADEGYVTGSSGQRVLAGLVDISGQPSGTSMRWKIALANNQSKIHGVSLAWA